MARSVHERWIISGTLVAKTPIHVGGFGNDVDTDLPLARDGMHQFYIPGTSVAGPLRMWCERTFGESETQNIWGYQDPNKSDSGAASHLIVEDIPIDQQYVQEIRDGVGIDREWGGAAEHLKYDRAILPRGTKLKLQMTLDIPDEHHGSAERMIAAMLDALARGEIRFGASKSRGLGRVEAKDLNVESYRLDNREGILGYLRNKAHSQVDWKAKARSTQYQKPEILTITIDWQPIEPVMVKAGYDGVAVDMLPLVSRCDDGLRLVLPGSGIKGAWRNQAERIIRTLLEIDVDPMGGNLRKRNLKALEVPLVTWLFGDRGRKQKKGTSNQANNGNPLPGLSALFIDDCYAQNYPIGVDKWNKLMTASEDGANGDFIKQLLLARLQSWKPTTHVAIDRWLGGASEGALYSILEPHGVEWEPIHVTLDLGRLEEGNRLPALALLLLVLRDFAQGWIPLGFATMRGMGSVSVKKIEFNFRGGDDDTTSVREMLGNQGDLKTILGIPCIQEAWTTWITSKREEYCK